MHFHRCLLFCRVLLRHPLSITAASYILHPVVMFKIPAHRLFNASFKSFFRMPIEFALDLANVHGVATIVAGTVLDERDEAVMGYDRVLRTKLIQQSTYRADDFKIVYFI